jgi:RNA polymerase sigma factor (sigma-70 family)
MQTTQDRDLLHQYAATGSEEAFNEILRRHVNLVYSAALRRGGNPEQAEEITQVVFIILARKARFLSEKVILSGWLYRTAGLAAANSIRAETRRKRRERELIMQPPSDEKESEAWNQIAPMLDPAMERLSRRDREAIVLRFFEGKTMQEVSESCGVTENAAKKRVYRGLEALRKFFARRGVALTGAMLAGAITANGAQVAPAALVTKIALLAKGAATTASATALLASTLKQMFWQKWKLAFAAGASPLVILATLVAVVNHSTTAVAHLQGIATEFLLDADGTRTNLRTVRFELWKRDLQWAVRLISNTNLPGAITELTSDGTNIYTYVPGAGGTHEIGNNVVRFVNGASIYPGTIKSFRFVMLPIWWGYCSSLTEAADGPIPDFTSGISDPVKPETPSPTVALRVSATNSGPRLGPCSMALYPISRSGQPSTVPQCDIVPMEVTYIGRLKLVTRCRMQIYSQTLADAPSRALMGYDVVVNEFKLENSSKSFIPELNGLTLIDDYRTSPFWKEYVSEHWIDPGEKTLHSPIPRMQPTWKAPSSNAKSKSAADANRPQMR